MTYYNSWAIGLESLKQERNTHKKCMSDGMLSKKVSKVDTNLVEQQPIKGVKG